MKGNPVADVVGTYQWSAKGAKATVGYVPCGHTTSFDDGTSSTIKPAFYGLVNLGHHGHVEYWAGTIATLATHMNSAGAPIPAAGVAQLESDPAQYTCPE